MRWWRGGIGVSLVLGLVGLPARTWAQPASAPAAGFATPSERAVRLNDAIRLYLQGTRDARTQARILLEGIRAADPRNSAALYYLGLIFLEEGLQASAAREDWPAARTAFGNARQCFENVIQSADPSLRPVEAALELGIAQLGMEDPHGDPQEAIRLSRQAADTLGRYVNTDAGRTDRYGHFYLAVADYRLAVRLQPKDKPVDQSLLGKSAERFRSAAALASQDRAAGKLSPEKFNEFETTVTYYDGLIDISRQRYPQAREKMLDVTKRLPGTTLALNAKQLSDFIEQHQRERPAPITLGTPLGPFEFQGNVNMNHAYDSNVILLGQDTQLPRRIAHKYDYQFGLGAGFDLSRPFTKADGILGESLRIGIGGTTSNTWHPSIKEFDINLNSGRAYINWEAIQDVFLGVEYDYSYIQLGHHGFISSNRITPVISKTWRGPGTEKNPRGEERARTDVYYSYDDRNYLDDIFDPRLDRDGNYHAVGISQVFNLCKASQIWKSWYDRVGPAKAADVNDGGRWLLIKAGYGYRNERTQGDEFDLYGNTVFGGVEVPLPWRLAFDFNAEFTWDRYTQPSILDFRRNQRRDFIQKYDFGVSRILVAQGECATMPTLQMRVRAAIDLTYQDSNIFNRLSEDIYSYDRAVYGITLNVDF